MLLFSPYIESFSLFFLRILVLVSLLVLLLLFVSLSLFVLGEAPRPVRKCRPTGRRAIRVASFTTAEYRKTPKSPRRKSLHDRHRLFFLYTAAIFVCLITVGATVPTWKCWSFPFLQFPSIPRVMAETLGTKRSFPSRCISFSFTIFLLSL